MLNLLQFSFTSCNLLFIFLVLWDIYLLLLLLFWVRFGTRLSTLFRRRLLCRFFLLLSLLFLLFLLLTTCGRTQHLCLGSQAL